MHYKVILNCNYSLVDFGTSHNLNRWDEQWKKRTDKITDLRHTWSCSCAWLMCSKISAIFPLFCSYVAIFLCINWFLRSFNLIHSLCKVLHSRLFAIWPWWRTMLMFDIISFLAFPPLSLVATQRVLSPWYQAVPLSIGSAAWLCQYFLSLPGIHC